MNHTTRMERLKYLYEKLIAILETYGKGEVDSQIREINHILNYIGRSATTSVKGREQLEQIEEWHNLLYPPRGGLSEFFIWSSDYDQRIILNQPLEEIEKEIWVLLKR
ncbi:hypothetical protein JCM19046_4891 [Bacillus sp. JCM 19046]|nr:hypothetical protein JCM19045_11 [Bacillus sp. JCM 19045]GAF20185.1 hypothetical protein JCM19046_4891 [Bacillus sp. JCM 19046]